MPVFPFRSPLSVFATNSLTAPTALYIYARGVSEGEMAQDIGFRDKNGALIDGAFTNFLQGVGASNNAVDLTTAVIEIDADTSSPFLGYVRLKLVVGASAA